MNKFYLFLALSLLVLSCNQKSVDEEMNDYCACRSEHKKTGNNFQECSDMMVQMLKKYEYDPEAVAVIEERVKTCE